MPFGAALVDAGVRFRVWAPSHQNIGLEITGRDGDIPMQRIADGWHELITSEAGPGSRYRYVLPNGNRVPDPASRFQPQDVHGPSQVIDPLTYQWHDSAWCGRAWEEAVIYETHVGAFTPE